MAIKRCVFKDFNNDTWVFENWYDAQGDHYRVTNAHGLVIAEAVGLNMSFQSWVQDLIKQAIDETFGGGE